MVYEEYMEHVRNACRFLILNAKYRIPEIKRSLIRIHYYCSGSHGIEYRVCGVNLSDS
jgi:hypothetical protein